MKINKHLKTLLSIDICIAFSGIVYMTYKFIPKMSIKKYTETCLYIAVMDDEICRNELEGNTINDKKIIFPPKRKSLQYRYHLFLNMYKQYSSKKLEEEVKKYENRLEESKQYLEKDKEELSVKF